MKTLIAIVALLALVIWASPNLSEPIEKYLKKVTYRKVNITKLSFLIAAGAAILLFLTSDFSLFIKGIMITFIVLSFNRLWKIK